MKEREKPKPHRVKCAKCGKEKDITFNEKGIPSNGWNFFIGLEVIDFKNLETSTSWLCSECDLEKEGK